MGLLLLAIGCSGSSSGPSPGGDAGGGRSASADDSRSFVPEGLENKSADGDETGRLKLIAFTLLQGGAGPELYAAVRNDGDAPSCNAGMQTDFYDKDGQLLTSVAGGLEAKQYYRLEPDVVLRCIDPGEIAMAAATNLPKELLIAELGFLMHSFPTFGLEGIVPIEGLRVSDVKAVAASGGTMFTGKVTNGFAVAITTPTVRVFPVNRVGRPLGIVTTRSGADLAPGMTWTFQTEPVNDAGAGFAAFPAGALSN